MIDPITSLAFSMHSNKGVYALLLGSGVSRTAGIPSGYEVTLDLVQKIAAMNGQQDECNLDSQAWYHKQYGKDPDYSELLDQLGHTQEERQAILRGYFEPTEEERENGIKLPTAAHKAIAQLIASGHIRVVITTNFDRLLEQALQDIGIHPNVISTPDAIEGTVPLVHTQHCIIKLHGDYLDCRIKNTEQELSTYDERINQLLNRVLDDFGLIVCGWSAEWDIALKEAFERCKNRRYAMYWLQVGGLKDAANRLTQHRCAQIIQSDGADSFFSLLLNKTDALMEMDQPHPLSVKAAISELKKYVAEDKYLIRLHDLVIGEVKHVITSISNHEFNVNEEPDNEKVRLRFGRYEVVTKILRGLISTGCFWGEPGTTYLWTQCIEMLAGYSPSQARYQIWLDFINYPTLLFLYTGGIASIAGNKLDNLAALTVKANLKDRYGIKPLIRGINARTVLHNEVKLLPGLENHKTPMSDHLFELLREDFSDLIPDNEKYENCFDRFEYYVALLYADNEVCSGKNDPWVPTGCFLWRNLDWSPDGLLGKALIGEIETEGESSPLLRTGMFGGSVDRIKIAKNAVDASIKNIGHL